MLLIFSQIRSVKGNKVIALQIVFSLLFPHRELQKTLERESRQCQVLVIWTDCDREGENIGFEVIHVCKAGKWCRFCVSVLWVHKSRWFSCTCAWVSMPDFLLVCSSPDPTCQSHWLCVLERVTEARGISLSFLIRKVRPVWHSPKAAWELNELTSGVDAVAQGLIGVRS